MSSQWALGFQYMNSEEHKHSDWMYVSSQHHSCILRRVKSLVKEILDQTTVLPTWRQEKYYHSLSFHCQLFENWGPHILFQKVIQHLVQWLFLNWKVEVLTPALEQDTELKDFIVLHFINMLLTGIPWLVSFQFCLYYFLFLSMLLFMFSLNFMLLFNHWVFRPVYKNNLIDSLNEKF